MKRTGVSIKRLYQDLGDFQITNISLEVPRGEYFIVLGPTGAGKTVLLETIAGIHVADRGKISIAGEDVKKVPPEDRDIGFVYQDYVLFPHMDVLENVMYGLKAREVTDPKARAEEVIDLLELNHLKNRYPRTLSGGESQKVSVARAIAYRPGLLLLDEPTAALDPRTKEKVRAELETVHEEIDVTTLHVTHDQSEAKILGDRIAVLMNGRLKQVGLVDEVFNEPVDEAVADFVGVENILEGQVTDYRNGVGVIETDSLTIEAVSEIKSGRVKVYLRPEDIFISDRPSKTSARNRIPGTVASVTNLGLVYRVNVDNGLSCFITKRSVEEFDLETGSEVFCLFKASSARVRQI